MAEGSPKIQANGATRASDMAGEAARVAVERSGSCRDTKQHPDLIPRSRPLHRHTGAGRVFTPVVPLVGFPVRPRLRQGYGVAGVFLNIDAASAVIHLCQGYGATGRLTVAML